MNSTTMADINATNAPEDALDPIRKTFNRIHKFFDTEVINGSLAELCLSRNSCSPSQEGSEAYCYARYKPSLHISGIVITGLIWCANILVLLLFARNRALRRAAANYLLLSLSLLDLFSGVSLAVFLVPYFYLHIAGCARLKENFGMSYYVAADQIVNFLFLASVGHLLALSTERVISLFWALNYEKVVRKNRIWIACSAIWLLALLLSSIQLTWQNFEAHILPKDAERIAKYDEVFSLIAFVVFATIPAIILVVQYSSMFILIKRLIKNCPGASQTRRSLRERKALIIYCAMFVSYFILVFPYFTLRIVIDHVDRRDWEKIPPELPESALMLRFIVSVINPLLYTLYKNDFRKALVRFYRELPLVSCGKRGIPRRETERQLLNGGMLCGETEMTVSQRRQSEVPGLKDVGRLFRRLSATSSHGAGSVALPNGTGVHKYKMQATRSPNESLPASAHEELAQSTL